VEEREHNTEESGRSRALDARARAQMRRERFHELVARAVEGLPGEFRERLENLDIVVSDWPSRAQLGTARVGSRLGLLGLYEGVPHTRRSRGYGMVVPDKITIFRRPIEARCRSWGEIEEEIRRVVRHEIAHHFGTDEHTLRSIEGHENRGGERRGS
jgi:predicted Zn-dependent protease with MMP-like domain